MELRSRSRSNTPFQVENFIEKESIHGSNHATVTRSTRSTVFKSATIGDESRTRQVYLSKIKSSKSSSANSRRKTAASYKTSDYSSEEGDVDVGAHISENDKNQIIEDAIAAANGTSEVSALNLYRKAGRYWDKYPKTDYTYSRHSRDRVEIAPGVVQMPNMSRRTIHLQDDSLNSETFQRSNTVRQKLFSSHDEFDHVVVKSSIFRRTFRSIFSVFIAIYAVTFGCLNSVSHVSYSVVFKIMKHLHHLVSRVMLLDTWLLRKADNPKRTKAVIYLCLLPLLLFVGWLGASSLTTAILSSVLNPSNTVTPEKAILPDEQYTEFLQNHKDQEILHSDKSGDISAHKEQELLTLIESLRAEITSIKSENIKRLSETNEEISSDEKRNLLILVGELKDEISKIKKDTRNLHRINSEMRVENLRRFAYFRDKFEKCCNNKASLVYINTQIAQSLEGFLNDPDFLSNQAGFSTWLHALFVAKEQLEARLSNITLEHRSQDSIKNTAEHLLPVIINKLAEQKLESVNDKQIEKIVKSALRIYDADRTGLVDYAMESMGGQVVTTRCTESFHSGTAVISILGVPVWYPTISPREALRPGIKPGECWAFQNFPGFLVIQLMAPVEIESFSMEHVSGLLVPGQKLDSAPKEFEVYGLRAENDREPVKLGEYVFDVSGESNQFFAVQNAGTFHMVELRIRSNNGNPNYTCLYRFRVHGKLAGEKP